MTAGTSRLGLSAVMALSLAACSTVDNLGNDAAPVAPSGPTQVQPPGVGNVPITGVRVYIKDGRPQAFVQGEIGDGCNSLQGIVQQRRGNTVDIAVTYKRAGEICAMIFQYLNEWVPLEGTLDAGEHTVRANGKAITFKLVRGADGRLSVDPDPGPLPQPPYRPFP